MDLSNILHAYAHYNPDVGYCQGMGRLVGMMLMQLPAEVRNPFSSLKTHIKKSIL